MVSFSSSVINKSGKKFAPKAPVRRTGASSAGAGSGRVSADRQTTFQPPSSSTAVAPAAPTKSNPPQEPTTEPHPQPPQQQQEGEEEEQTQSQPEPPAESQAHSPTPQRVRGPQIKSTAIPIPAPRWRPSVPTIQQSPPAPSPSQSPGPPTSKAAPSPSIARPDALADASPATVLQQQQNDNQKPPLTTESAPRSPKRLRVEEPSDKQPAPAKRTRISVPVAKPVTRPISPLRQELPQATAGKQTESSEPQAGPTAAKCTPKKAAKPPAKENRSAEKVSEDDTAADTQRKPRARRKRQPTPEDAELIEISPTIVKMADLCRDLRTGKKSRREMELQNMELTELAIKQREREERIRNGPKSPKAGSADRCLDDNLDRAEAASLGGPQMRIVNGEIVVDAASLQIDRHANAARNEGDMEEVEENPLTKRINAASFGKRTKVESWDADMTDLFYRGLRMFGTDFMMISKMFPGRSRRQIKLKFSNEERRYPERIKETLLGPREPVDMVTYSEMTNTVYDDPRVIERELDEEKKRIEAEHAKEKEAREEQMRNPGGGSNIAGPSDLNVLPSIENGTDGAREKKRAHKFGGGPEEILGTIDDITVSA
ncbi:hypothetical protein GX48_03934 [Paracoccidioides brasiliensis]|nr:hypothetical protein GX48_03934 [Paracoccidioides brasiliensis]